MSETHCGYCGKLADGDDLWSEGVPWQCASAKCKERRLTYQRRDALMLAKQYGEENRESERRAKAAINAMREGWQR